MKIHELTVEGVRFSFGSVEILSDVYLSCRTGDIVGLFGRNGSGKSTLLQIIFGTLNSLDKIIRIDNKVYAQPYLIKDLIAYLPQFSFLPANISLRRIIRMYVASIRHRNSLFEDRAIQPHLEKTTAELSGGELRYLEILLVLSSKAKFILLDEPFMGIEPIYQEKIKELISSNKGVKGFVITDHTYSAVTSISNHMLLISKGRVDKVSTEEELMEKGYLPPRQSTIIPSIHEIPATPVNSQFEIDKQTFKDLGIFEDNRNGAFFRLFSSVKTIGGNTALMNMLLNPTYDISFLESRRDSIQFFVKHRVEMRLNKVHMEMIDYYLSSPAPLLRDDIFHAMQRLLSNNGKQRNDEHIIKSGVSFLLSLLEQLSEIAEQLVGKDAPDYLLAVASTIEEFVSAPPLVDFINYKLEPGPADFAKLDKVFRTDPKGKLKTILGIVYEIEVFECLSALVDNLHFSLPEYSGAKEGGVQIAGLFHPLVQNPVANDFTIGETKNVCLLTG
ncbi:MAG TPA: ATP-binding cassette domain-containing protein, partial [Flavitalea sp.]|nr:ATP-binding cassette domain-containing protein [Flavitalea sp.]